MTNESSASPAPARTKKLPFKPTALCRAPPPQSAHAPRDAVPAAADDDGDDNLALFRRAKEMEPIVAADQERRMRKKHRLDEKRRHLSTLGRLGDDGDDHDHDHDAPPSHPQQMQGEQCRQSLPPFGEDGPDIGELVRPPASKRTKVDDPASSERPILSLDEAPVAPADPPTTSLPRCPSRFATPGSSADGPTATPLGPRHDKVIICLESGEEDNDSVEATTGQRPSAASFSEEHDETPLSPADDEFGEYVRKAAEQRDLDRALTRTESNGAPKQEAVDVLVTSSVPSSVPCRFKFLFDKPLRMIRDCWVDLQRKKGVPLPPSHDDDVVLTWRRNKVYGSSTLLSLGIRPRGRGRVRVDGSEHQAGLMDKEAGIHMEAWTLDLFHEMERRKREAGALSKSDDHHGDDRADDKAAPGASQMEARLRLVLKARAFDDVRLTVRPGTTVETLLTGFRTRCGIGPDRDVSLWFDGERLDEHVTVEAAEMDDMDTVEVHLK